MRLLLLHSGDSLKSCLSERFPNLFNACRLNLRRVEICPDSVYADRFVSKIEGPELLFQILAALLQAYGYNLETSLLI